MYLIHLNKSLFSHSNIRVIKEEELGEASKTFTENNKYANILILNLKKYEMLFIQNHPQCTVLCTTTFYSIRSRLEYM
jgi:hypothetical protein